MIVANVTDYRAALPEGGVLVGLDVGTQTIGVAFCDAGWTFATADSTISRTKFARDRALLAEAIATRPTRGIVVGLPLNMDGSDSPRTQSTRAFARNIADLGFPILLWDERWSTVAVERQMIAADMSRAKRAARIDAHAAAHILQAAIDALAAG